MRLYMVIGFRDGFSASFYRGRKALSQDVLIRILKLQLLSKLAFHSITQTGKQDAPQENERQEGR